VVFLIKPMANCLSPQETINLPLSPRISNMEIFESAVAVKVYRTRAELVELRPAWNEILAAGSGSTIFSAPEWLCAWWNSYGEAGQLVAVAVFADGRLVGLAPLYAERVPSFVGIAFKALRFLGDGSTDSDNLGFIIRPGYEEIFVRVFLKWFSEQREWALCKLRTMPSDSPTAQFVLQAVRRLGWFNASATLPRSAILLPESWANYLAKLSTKERSKIGYLRRRVERLYTARVHKCTSPEELPRCLENLFALHQKRWNARGGEGAFSSAQRREFYRQMTHSLLLRGLLELWSFDLDGRTVAVQCGIRYGNVVYALQEGFDPGHAADSVGYVLRSYVLQHLIEEGIRRYDFLAGEEKSKERWATDHGDYLGLDFVRPDSSAVLHFRVSQKAKSAKEYLRMHLPPFLWRTLQTTRQKIGVFPDDNKARDLGGA
jgi:CelD/BcsL family acetyltransferase involved in cellulose biosynthesis